MTMRITSALLVLTALGCGALTPVCSAADSEAATPVATGKADPATTCVACGKPMTGTPKTTTVDGEALPCCSDACAAKVKENPQYYKGVYDGEMRMKIASTGPKGGDSRKSVDGVSPN